MNALDRSRRHLLLSQTNYINHLIWAIKGGVILICIGMASIIHAFFPFMFEGTTAKNVIKIFYEHLYKHPNPEYKKLIKEYNNE